MTVITADPLADLRHHWGSAYLLLHPQPDVWVAVRRDDHGAVRADSPAGLLRAIRDDYAARAVPR